MLVVILIALVTGSVAYILRMPRRKMDYSHSARNQIKVFEIAIGRYREDLGAYPPDDITLASGSAENGMSEVLVQYLARPCLKDGCVYGPYMLFEEARLTDQDDDGFQEYRDPWGYLFLYAENASHKAPTGMNPKSFDLVSPGPDGELGGSIGPATGYVPATTPAGKAREKDNIANWRR
ncbi:MAG: hypothetical protein ACYTFI_14955 [Planctomycetota bacterium]